MIYALVQYKCIIELKSAFKPVKQAKLQTIAYTIVYEVHLFNVFYLKTHSTYL